MNINNTIIIEQYLLMMGCFVDLEWFERKKKEKREGMGEKKKEERK